MRRLTPLVIASFLAACAPMPPGGYPVAYGQQQAPVQAVARPVVAGAVRWESPPSPVVALAAQVYSAVEGMPMSDSDRLSLSAVLYDAGGGRRVLLMQDGPWSGTSMHGFGVYVDPGTGRFQSAGAASARGASPGVAVLPVRGGLPSFRVTGEMFDPRRPNAPARQRTVTLRYDQGAGKYVEDWR